MSTSEDDDYPQIGKRKRGMIMVCHGDDRPTEFANWLQPLVDDFNELFLAASEHGIDMDLQDGSDPILDELNFCERLGIEFDSNMWEGSLISGIYRFGWIKVGTVRSAAARGRKIMRVLKKNVELAVRSSIIRELQGIKDFDDFINRTSGDQRALYEEISKLRASLQANKTDLESTIEKLNRALENDTKEIDRSCLRFALALLSNDKRRLVAGPVVLWDDGVIYAIVSWGGQPMPEKSSPKLLLDELQASGRRVILVKDMTVIGGWLSGPIYRKGPKSINEWSRVWSRREQRARSFSVDPPEFAERVQEIHNVLAAKRE